MKIKLNAFKAYDVRGKMPDELNESIAYQIGRGLARTTQASQAILGMDSRISSPLLLKAVAAGLMEEGVSCRSLGLCGTEEVYYAAGVGYADIGIMITASHNPMEYNGMKFVKKGGLPFDPSEDLVPLEEFVRANISGFVPESFPEIEEISYRNEYVAHLMALILPESIPPQTIVINAGNGAAGPTADAILANLPQLNVIRINHRPDGTFPNGIPNPFLPGNRKATSDAVIENDASIGIAWDGDFDRCFLYDDKGNFVNSYYLVGMLAQRMLDKYPGSSIVHDPRLFWDTEAAILGAGGKPVIGKVGHGHIKPAMREHDSPFVGEISGHFYFRDFFFCDTGMLPWMLVLQHLGQKGQTLSEALNQSMSKNFASDEINFYTPLPAREFLKNLESFLPVGRLSYADGITISSDNWRANIRASNTEPLLRLNVEAVSSHELREQLDEIRRVILDHNGQLAKDH
ncbi:MAG: phosphomannomutase/phosphoglucomutase [Blastochloris viridis]|uniref:Phosphomannomutase/phosphoglucomutase n=1 Tax=Blastochloris viridis TaxID=1079 RepID=A0A6N4RBR0_BLAVI|nr:MAG: phosphomannomutase/phosphoglucomutase [Blastochloris viridis]